MRKESTHLINDEALYLVGFCIRTSDIPEIYTLISAGGEIDRPILIDNAILFFDAPQLISKALELSTSDLKKLPLPSEEVALTCYIREMLQLIDTESIDESATILNCLNTFFDLIDAVEQALPDNYKHLLYSFADHLTFHREFATFIRAQHLNRITLRQAIDWCIRTISAKSTLLTSQGWVQEFLWSNIREKESSSR